MQPVVIVGLGELGTVFATGMLKLGHPVFPVLRGQSLTQLAADQPAPHLVLVAVGEWDLESVLAQLPSNWRADVALVQNELVPSVWRPAGLSPSVCIVWFEKRRSQTAKVLLPSLAYGPRAALLTDALKTIGIPCERIENEARLRFELAKKSLYILTLNLAGLRTRGNASNLWREHYAFARSVAEEVIALQSALLASPLPEAELLRELEGAIAADPEHGCLGRTAARRLARALENAHAFGLHLPTLAALGREFLPE